MDFHLGRRRARRWAERHVVPAAPRELEIPPDPRATTAAAPVAEPYSFPVPAPDPPSILALQADAHKVAPEEAQKEARLAALIGQEVARWSNPYHNKPPWAKDFDCMGEETYVDATGTLFVEVARFPIPPGHYGCFTHFGVEVPGTLQSTMQVFPAVDGQPLADFQRVVAGVRSVGTLYVPGTLNQPRAILIPLGQNQRCSVLFRSTPVEAFLPAVVRAVVRGWYATPEPAEAFHHYIK